MKRNMPLSTPRRLGRSSSELSGSAGEAGDAGEEGDAGEADAGDGADAHSPDSTPRTGGSGSSPHLHDCDDLSPVVVLDSSTSVSDCTGVPPREPLLRCENQLFI